MSPNNTETDKTNAVISASLEGKKEARAEQRCHPPDVVGNLAFWEPLKTSVIDVVKEKSTQEVLRQGIGSVSTLVTELLCDIYGKMETKRRESAATCDLTWPDSDRSRSSSEAPTLLKLTSMDLNSLRREKAKLEELIAEEGNLLVKHLKRKNFLSMRREAHYDIITAYIQAISPKTREDTKMKFSLSPNAETGFSQWLDAMKMVAQLPGGMPVEFRTKLWLQLSEKHLTDQNVDWEKAEAIIFNEWTNPDDEELGVQIVKDLHRTGCSLFCGEQEHNQALLKRVLLAYARWNKNVGYCQGFNMLAALILQVMDKNEKNAVKVMIYLIEGVLPESYFANNLRGLSVDMAVFRDLLRLRLPRLSKHLEALQHDTNTGTNYEPPLTNVFTMQWFLTLFSNCLPHQTVLRVWDLVFLYGNEVLLRTALAIWGILQDRVITVESADEFYSIMGVVTREMLEFGLMDANTLVKVIAMVDPFPNELQELREKYLYNISPWTQSVHCAARRGIKLLYGEPDDQDDTEDEDKIALTTAYGVFRRRDSASRDVQISGPTLDIGILKQQYAKLRQRQRQAHVIITAACSSTLAGGIATGPSVSVNHLLMGKSALVNKGRRIGPPEGSIPPFTSKKANIRDPKRSNQVDSYERKRATGGSGPILDCLIDENKREETFSIYGKKKTQNGNKHELMNESTDEFNAEIAINSERKSTLSRYGECEDAKHAEESDSSSTELCDEQNCVSESDESSEILDSSILEEWREIKEYDVQKTRENSRKPLEIGNSVKSVSDDNLWTKTIDRGIDKNRIGEIRQLAEKLLDEIENEIQGSERLIKKKEEAEAETEGHAKLNPEPEQNFKCENKVHKKIISSSVGSEDLPLTNDTLRLEPVVPINETEENVRLEEKCRIKKTHLGLNVIKENLQILHKFSCRTVQLRSLPVHEAEEDGTQECLNLSLAGEEQQGERLEISKIGTPVDFVQFHEELHLGDTVKTDIRKLHSNPKDLTNVGLTITNSTAEEMSTCAKVNKEVNTEISFGRADEFEATPKKEELKRAVYERTPSECRWSRGLLSRMAAGEEGDRRGDDGEIEAKIEVSKTDWELKMRKIAELDTMTREALNEMQDPPMHRKWVHRSLDRTTRRTHRPLDVDLPNGRGKLKSSGLSFDAITSRTEKLLGNVQFSRSTDESVHLPTQEFVYRKPKGPGPKNRLRPLNDVESDGCLTSRYGTEVDEEGTRDNDPGASEKARRNGAVLHLHALAPCGRQPLAWELQSGSNPFNPFPTRTHSKPKKLGMKFGLYATSPEDQPKKL